MRKQEFDVLRTAIELQNNGFSYKDLQEKIIEGLRKIYSVDSLKNLLTSFRNSGVLDEKNQLTEKGYIWISPYKVKNAIILAAGMSTRFIPVSYELPKGLISVKGEVLIEREIRQLQEAGIQEIVVVVGYMMEKFFYLRDKYKVKLVVNNEFSTKNTHSSVYAARDYLSNTYILCSDNYYSNNMFHQYEYNSYYCSTFLPGTSYVERAVVFNNDGLIISTNKPSHDQWIMSGHAYLDKSFTEKYISLLMSYYDKPGVDNMYWENIYTENIDQLSLWVKKCQDDEILEFDSMSELKAFDPNYIYNNKIKVFENISNILGCKIEDIEEMFPIKKGLTNQCFKFRVSGVDYIYRHPGPNSSQVVDRKKEAISLKVAKKLGLDKTLVYIDEDDGWKISKFIETTEEFDFRNLKHVRLLAEKLKILHGSNITVGFGFDYEAETKKIIDLLKLIDPLAYRRCLLEQQAMRIIFDYLKNDRWQISLCHNDLYEPNLLLSGDELNIIDWEFAGDADIGFDICKLFAVSNPDIESCDDWIEPYFGSKPSLQIKRHLCACATIIYYYWYIWGIYTGKSNQEVSDYLITWFDKMNYFRVKTLDLFKEE